MPSVTFNGQSFAIDNRRFWVVGATLHYSRMPAADWPARIADAKQAGFNTVLTACPWSLHEPRKGRFDFQGDQDLRRYVTLCHEAGLKVILRVGPFIGDGFDGGGLPNWLAELDGIAMREANEPFLEHASRYLRKLIAEVADLQATDGKAILLVQSEHAWVCSNPDQADVYLAEVTRFIRESGINVPVINANDLWQESPGTIDTWRGGHDLLINLRQLRALQPQAPRLVSSLELGSLATWSSRNRSRAGAAPESEQPLSADGLLSRVAETLAAGAQLVVQPFHCGTNFAFRGGRLAGRSDAFVATTPYAEGDAPLGESGTRAPSYHAMRRLITFANHFGNVFAELEPEYHPIALDLAEVAVDKSPKAARAGHGSPDRHGGQRQRSGGPAIVPLRGSQGQIVFVFADGGTHHATLLLEDGIRLSVELGDQPVGWFVLDADLQGAGRLDYANLCPFAIVDRSIVILHGPEGAPAMLSFNGAPLETRVPASGGKPVVVDHKGMTFVICNQAQVDATYFDDTTVYVGVSGLSAAGPMPHTDYPKAWVIRKQAEVHQQAIGAPEGGGGSRKGSKRESGPATVAFQQWLASSCDAYVTGASPRFASLEGPETLSACGAAGGYGWYRIEFDHGAAKKKLLHAPEASDRVHLFLDGKPQHLFGVGAGASAEAFSLSLAKGSNRLVALADNFGRFSEGNDLMQRPGFAGHVQEIKPLKTSKPRRVEGKPIDAFKLRGYIAGSTAGQPAEAHQMAWTFTHTRKTPILLQVLDATPCGVFALNDQPVGWYSGRTGGCVLHLLLDPKETKALKRGSNTLRFAPAPHAEHGERDQESELRAIADAVTMYECVETLTEGATWSFAKWEPPHHGSYAAVPKGQTKPFKGRPCWWKATAVLDREAVPPEAAAAARWVYSVDVSGLSKGQVFINGHNLGRYFSATADGKSVGPQTSLRIPNAWLKPGEANELVIFDEHGFDPHAVKLVAAKG